MSKNAIIFLFFGLLLISFVSCKDSNGKSIFEPNRIEPPKLEDRERLLNQENVGRGPWQQPDLVVNKLGDINGKLIADIGTGTGYFVPRLAFKNARVIAIDIDTVMLQFVDALKESFPKQVQNNISTRLAEPDDPNLENEEVDIAMIVNTVSYIENLEKYLGVLKKGVKKTGSVMIVDYKNKIIPIPAPPLEDRVTIGRLQTYLANMGYKNIVVDDTSLKYQYIVTANVN